MERHLYVGTLRFIMLYDRRIRLRSRQFVDTAPSFRGDVRSRRHVSLEAGDGGARRQLYVKMRSPRKGELYLGETAIRERKLQSRQSVLEAWSRHLENPSVGLGTVKSTATEGISPSS